MGHVTAGILSAAVLLLPGPAVMGSSRPTFELCTQHVRLLKLNFCLSACLTGLHWSGRGGRWGDWRLKKRAASSPCPWNVAAHCPLVASNCTSPHLSVAWPLPLLLFGGESVTVDADLSLFCSSGSAPEILGGVSRLPET